MRPCSFGLRFPVAVTRVSGNRPAGSVPSHPRRKLTGRLLPLVMLVAWAPQADADMPKVSEILEHLRPRVHSYDVYVDCTSRSMIRLTYEDGQPFDTRKIHSPTDRRRMTMTIVDEKDAEDHRESFRQTYVRQGADRPPLWRREECDPETGAARSWSASDGSIKRSLARSSSERSIGDIGVSDGREFIPWTHNYLVLLGFFFSGREGTSISDVLSNRHPESIEVIEESPSVIAIYLPPVSADTIPADGWRVWLNRDKGWAMEKFEVYSYMPNFAQSGDDIPPLDEWERNVSAELVIEAYHQFDDSTWVPARAVFRQFRDRGPDRGKLTNRTDLVVDVERSRWNVDLPSDLFTFDFPSGTLVIDTIHGINLTVGDRPAGHDLEQLVAEGIKKFPHSRDPKSLEAAGWVTKDTVAAEFRREQSLEERLQQRLRDARLGYQRVLLVIGDPESPWVYKFFSWEGEEKLSKATYNYLFLPISTVDASQREAAKQLVARLGVTWPQSSEAVLAVLDEEGRFVVEAPSRELATDDELDQHKLFDFLSAHGPELPDARKLLADALVRAKREGKRVFVQDSGPRCGPCVMLSRFLDDHRGIVEKEFVNVKLDRRMAHGEQVLETLRRNREGGVPWMVILDADGRELVTSNGPDGRNIGCPSSEEGIAHFETMLRTGARDLIEDDIAMLIAALSKKKPAR